ncbi:MAG TPA: DUF4386 domain-containing protein [Candidatus Dormibacteraeota bacterium]|nr:DUF4386 domain-containing protein [Candidatus Dormibacteraeota bacterium]
MTSPKTLGRITGMLYLVGSLGPVLAMVLRSRVVQSADAAATADHIRASEVLLRVDVAVGLVSLAAWLFAVTALYRLLRHAGRLAATAMVVTVTAAVAVECMNLVSQLTALTVATSPAYTGALGEAGANAAVMLAADLWRNGALLVGLFWGLWLLPLGYLVFRSGTFPKVVGALLILGGGSYLTVHFVSVLAPSLAGTVSYLLVGDIGELVFVVWLLVKGGRLPPSETAGPSAQST